MPEVTYIRSLDDIDCDIYRVEGALEVLGEKLRELEKERKNAVHKIYKENYPQPSLEDMPVIVDARERRKKKTSYCACHYEKIEGISQLVINPKCPTHGL